MIAREGSQITQSWYYWERESQMATYGERNRQPGIYLVVANEGQFFPLGKFTKSEYTDPESGQVITAYRAAITAPARGCS
jgi:hypothetical protein